MKRAFVLIISVAVLFVVVMAVSASPGASGNKKKAASITGTWQLASYKYGAVPSAFIDVQPGVRHIKLITETAFLWVIYDTNTKRVTSSGGGMYTLDGDTYTESIDYGLGMDPYLGMKPVYTIKVEGDMLFISGFLYENYKVEEIWQRVR